MNILLDAAGQAHAMPPTASTHPHTLALTSHPHPQVPSGTLMHPQTHSHPHPHLHRSPSPSQPIEYTPSLTSTYTLNHHLHPHLHPQVRSIADFGFCADIYPYP